MMNRKMGWEVRKLKDLGTNKNSIVSGPFGSNLKVKDYKDFGVPIIRLQNIDKGYFLKKDIKYISDEKANELKYHSFNVGDIVLAKLGIPIGKTCIVPNDFGFGIIVADVVRIRPDPKKINYKFLELFLNSDISVKQLTRNISGATRPRVNLDDVRNIDVYLPPLEEQKQIVAILDKAFEKIEKAKEIAEKNLKNAKELFESYLQEVFENKGEGWEEKTLGEVCYKITDGSHNPPKEVDFSNYMMLSSRNIFNDKINLNSPRYLEEQDFISENKRTEIKEGDVLLTIVGTIGRVAVVEKEHNFTLQRSVAVLKPRIEKIQSRFLMFLLRNIFEELQENAKGVAQKGIYLKQIRELKIFIPYKKEQEFIIKNLDSLQEKTKQLETIYQQKLNNLEELKKSILQKAFNGELETIKEIAA